MRFSVNSNLHNRKQVKLQRYRDFQWQVLIMEEAIYLRESKEGLMYMYLTLHSHII